MPTLAEYIRICKKYEKHCILELKSVFTEEETAAFIELIKGYDYLDGVTFISFHYDNLLKVRAILPEQSCQFLTGENSDEMIAKLAADKLDIDIHHASLTEERVQAMHKAGITINCWTVDSPELATKLVEMGVDYITSNILE